jgi:hypothetical protein
MDNLGLGVLMIVHSVGTAVEHAEKHLVEVNGRLDTLAGKSTTVLDRAAAMAELTTELRIIRADIDRALAAVGDDA